MNKRTAFVYAGAAVLILVFGFRTLARTLPELSWLSSILTPVTVVALLFEFALLIFYAHGIYYQDDYEGSSSGNSDGSNSPDFSGLNQISSSINDYSEKLSNIETHLGDYNNEIKKINEKMDSLVDEQLNEKVKNILAKLLKEKL